MLLTTKARYAVMAMVDIATHSCERTVSLAEISLRQGIDAGYLEQIFAKLKKNGLVESVRGPGGGYKLTRKANNTLVSDIMYAVEENLKMTRCKDREATGCLHDKSRCTTHYLWEELGDLIYDYLKSVSLEDIIEKRLSKRKWAT